MRHLTEFALIGFLLLVVGGCTDTTNNVLATPAPTLEADSTRTTNPVPADNPTPVPPATVTNEQRIEAATLQLAIDIAATEPISNTIDAITAYDVLTTSVNTDNGNVTVTICSWNGDTIFDDVRDALYQIETTNNGEITATLITAARGAGDCLNTELINTALNHIDEYDLYWAEILADPRSFDPEAPATVKLADQFAERSAALVFTWQTDDIYFERPFSSLGGVRSQTVADILYRRYTNEGSKILEIVVCRDMNPVSGAYRDGALIDDRRGPDDPGLHAINSYQLAASEEVAVFELVGTSGLGWADCFRTGDWNSAANDWRPADTAFTPLPS